MKRRDFIKLGAGFGAALATQQSPAWAQTKMVLKAADVHPLGYPTVEAVVRMGKKLETATNGRLTIQMFPSMQLGGEKEMIEQAQLGALQIARISVGAVGPVVDDVNVFCRPYPETRACGVIGTRSATSCSRISANEKAGLIALPMNAGSRNIYNNAADPTWPTSRPQGPHDEQPLFADTRERGGAMASPSASIRSSARCRPAWSMARKTIRLRSWRRITTRLRNTSR
jgi:hypothetical protein